MADDFDVVIETGEGSDVVLDASSARELEIFLTRVETSADAPLERRVIVWKDGTRRVMDVRAFVDTDGSWRLAFGAEHPESDAPDRAAPVDSRLDELDTMVWLTDVDRLARWFNRAWCDFVGA